jgi:hypothetical protein
VVTLCYSPPASYITLGMNCPRIACAAIGRICPQVLVETRGTIRPTVGTGPSSTSWAVLSKQLGSPRACSGITIHRAYGFAGVEHAGKAFIADIAATNWLGRGTTILGSTSGDAG